MTAATSQSLLLWELLQQDTSPASCPGWGSCYGSSCQYAVPAVKQVLDSVGQTSHVTRITLMT